MTNLNLKRFYQTVLILILAGCAQNPPKRTPAEQVTRLQDSPYFEYDVRFTNPECKEYKYSEPVQSVSGKPITGRPKNVYCTSKDGPASAERPFSPQYKLLEWINDAETKEIFFTYLSFSNQTVQKALCDAATQRGVKITFILDKQTGTGAADALTKCGTETNRPQYFLRGHTSGIGFAHNKFFIINPSSNDKIRIAIGSGNLTSGVVLHHENWHFITTHASTYYAQSHLCVMRGTLDEKIDSSGQSFKKFMKECRAKIQAPEETDVKAFFIPGDGDRATQALIKGMNGAPGISSAKQIWLAAHRFSYNKMRDALKQRLNSSDPVEKPELKIVTDDDLYWAGKTHAAVGPNTPTEYFNVEELEKLGARPRYMETNDKEFMLHHNKYLIFDEAAVFSGAGNLTGDAFNKNHENFYYITIPSVIAKFRTQYEHVYNDLATSPENMPSKHVFPGEQR